MTTKIKVLSVNISSKRGRKFPKNQIVLNESGIEGDVHINTLRPVSMMDISAAEKFYKITGAKPLEYGSFAENITFASETQVDIHVFDRFCTTDIILEVIFKGKPFHDQFLDPGHYLMPREGIFCRVLQGGILKTNDEMLHIPKVFKIKIITLSDRISKGINEDISGSTIAAMAESFFKKLNWRHQMSGVVIPDDEAVLDKILAEEIAQNTDMIITTGGTGIGPRDITPEVIRKHLKKEIPGIIELIRWKYGIEKPAALLSRAMAGVSGTTLLFALPGSPKAVKEYMTEIIKQTEHIFYMIHAIDTH